LLEVGQRASRLLNRPIEAFRLPAEPANHASALDASPKCSAAWTASTSASA
jgi:hypothetical protein